MLLGNVQLANILQFAVTPYRSVKNCTDLQ